MNRSSYPRRYDLDALRATAMLLGIVLHAGTGEGREKTDTSREESAEFLKAMASPIFAVPLFHHLWFLWFLCWLVLVFALYARLADWLQWQGPPKWLLQG